MSLFGNINGHVQLGSRGKGQKRSKMGLKRGSKYEIAYCETNQDFKREIQEIQIHFPKSTLHKYTKLDRYGYKQLYYNQ